MFYCKNMEVEDGINLYYKLKSEYEEEVKKFKRKQKTFPRKKRMLMGKPLCIQCQRPVGSVFSCHFDKNKEERVLKARCGDMTHPCAFRILIHLGDFVSVVSLLSEYEKNIQDLKREIIQEKNNLLFGYIKPEKAVESFTLLKNDFDATLDLYEFTLQHDYREKVENKEKMQEMSSLQDEYQSAQEIALPTTYVINSNRHYERFHPSKDPEGKIENRHACVVPRECEDAFTPDLLAMMIAGSVLYEEDKMTDYQRRLALRVLPKMNFIVSGKEIVFGTNIDGLTGLTIDQDFSNPANRSVLLQLIGRIGRVGMSYEARVMVESTESLLKIMKTPVYHPQENPDPDVVAMQTAWTNA